MTYTYLLAVPRNGFGEEADGAGSDATYVTARVLAGAFWMMSNWQGLAMLGRTRPDRPPPRSSAAQTLNVEIAVGDLTDLDSLRRPCDGVSGILHTSCTFTNTNVDIAAMQAMVDG